MRILFLEHLLMLSQIFLNRNLYEMIVWMKIPMLLLSHDRIDARILSDDIPCLMVTR
jgi:hypothetical protein